MTAPRFFSLLIVFCLSVFTMKAQIGDTTPEYDQRVKNALDSLELKYNITDKGNFHLVFNLGNDRTQLVIVLSNTYDYEGIEIREIISTVQVADKKSDFKTDLLFELLEKNQTYKIGAWQIHGGKAPFVLQFGIRVSANSTPTVLDKMVRLAAKVADEMELRLTKADKN